MSNIQNQENYVNRLNSTKISIEENKPILKTEHNYLHICTFKSPTLSAFISDKGNHAISEGVKNGYTLIKKNPNTQKIEIIYPYNYEAKNNEILQKNCRRGIKSMINNWNNYRDDLNELLGDISPYYNYKETIQQMIDEDTNLFEELYNHKSAVYSDNDSDYYSDND